MATVKIGGHSPQNLPCRNFGIKRFSRLLDFSFVDCEVSPQLLFLKLFSHKTNADLRERTMHFSRLVFTTA